MDSRLPSPDFGDRTLSDSWAVVTGGTRGIGFEVARGLVKRGVRVLLTGRDSATGEAAASQLNRGALAPATARFLAVDFTRRSEVLEFAKRIASITPRVDLLIHNAAIVTRSRTLTPDGFETQFAVNHLAPYLLSRELLPLLLAAKEGRIVVTASQVERHAILDFEDLMGNRTYDPGRAYNQSKLANVLFTYELAERLSGLGDSSVTVNCLHPGVVRTRLLDMLGSVQEAHAPKPAGASRILHAARRQLGNGLRAVGLRSPVKDWALTPGEGALTTLFVSMAPELRGVSGRYFADCKEAESSKQSHDVELRRRLWDVSAQLVGVSKEWPDPVVP